MILNSSGMSCVGLFLEYFGHYDKSTASDGTKYSRMGQAKFVEDNI